MAEFPFMIVIVMIVIVTANVAPLIFFYYYSVPTRHSPLATRHSHPPDELLERPNEAHDSNPD